MRFEAGNYIERSTDAVFFRIGDATLYFKNHKLIAVVMGGTFYQLETMTGKGSLYRSLRQVRLHSPAPRTVIQMKAAELQGLAEGAIIMASTRELTDRLDKGELK